LGLLLSSTAELAHWHPSVRGTVAGNHQEQQKQCAGLESFLTVQHWPVYYAAIALSPIFIALGLTMFFEVVAAFLVVLSVGIFLAHALDAYRS